MTSWSDIARATIERVAATIPESATLKERKALLDAAYPFGSRSHWPYKAWCKARRRHLERHGLKPRRRDHLGQIALFDRDPLTGRPIIP